MKFFNVKNKEDQIEIFVHCTIGKDYFDNTSMASDEFSKILSDIPKNKNILLHINSPGGSVSDGLAIYNMLKERKGKVKCRIDCLAASIASVIMCAADEIEMVKSGIVMIHKPWCDAGGNANDLRKVAGVLDMWEDSMNQIYVERTGLKKEEISALLEEETWMKAETALSKGFVDKIVDDEEKKEELVAALACFDFSNMKHAVDFLPVNKTTPKIKIDNKMTIKEKVMEAAKAGKIAESEVDSWVALIENNAEVQFVLEKLPDKADANQSKDALASLQRQVEEMQKLELNRKKAQEKADIERAKAAVENAVKDGRIDNTESEIWINNLLSSEKNYAILEKQNIKTTNVSKNERIIEVSPSVHSVFSAMKGMVGKARYSIIMPNLEKVFGWVKEARNEITVDQGLKQTIIMATALDQFSKTTGPITKLFSTCFNPDLSQGGLDTVTIRYYPLFSQQATQFYYKGKAPGDEFEGYGNDVGSYTIQKKEISCQNRLKIEVNWSSKDLARTPFFDLSKIEENMANDLAWQMYNYVHSFITSENFPNVALLGDTDEENNIALSDFDTDTLSDMSLKVSTMQWGKREKNLVINSLFENQLRKDPAIKAAYAYGDNSVIRDGILSRINGINIYTDNPNLPHNNERLSGYLCLPTALGIVNAPIRPADSIPTVYEQAVDPNTGITLEGRWFGDSKDDKVYHALEVNVGCGVLEPLALLRVVEAASTFNPRNGIE
jgi:ATP-dependent Clp protease, protease subunit